MYLVELLSCNEQRSIHPHRIFQLECSTLYHSMFHPSNTQNLDNIAWFQDLHRLWRRRLHSMSLLSYIPILYRSLRSTSLPGDRNNRWMNHNAASQLGNKSCLLRNHKSVGTSTPDYNTSMYPGRSIPKYHMANIQTCNTGR